ncbi:hypothetical protein F2P81_001720 [Scophthalmus maximus]|uniref:Uncharacterized protein n=1 Tax=Scophthalmus maximus TaxID=52904 RepID=A0A6A4TR02_SCOMX|nr:hypothetical protein F2P81_001720 [Scophthalmus maximus]
MGSQRGPSLELFQPGSGWVDRSPCDTRSTVCFAVNGATLSELGYVINHMIFLCDVRNIDCYNLDDFASDDTDDTKQITGLAVITGIRRYAAGCNIVRRNVEGTKVKL